MQVAILNVYVIVHWLGLAYLWSHTYTHTNPHCIKLNDSWSGIKCYWRDKKLRRRVCLPEWYKREKKNEIAQCST